MKLKMKIKIIMDTIMMMMDIRAGEVSMMMSMSMMTNMMTSMSMMMMMNITMMIISHNIN